MNREIAKSQWVRIWDVLGFAPLMLWIGLRNDFAPHEKLFMVIGSITMWIFNFDNLLRDKPTEKEILEKPAYAFKTASVFHHPPERKFIGNWLRMIDILYWGPMMLKINRKYKLEPWEKVFMEYGGWSTIYVNGLNYIMNEKLKKGEI